MNQRQPHRKVFSFTFDNVDGGLFLLSLILAVIRRQCVTSVVMIIPPPLRLPLPAFHG